MTSDGHGPCVSVIMPVFNAGAYVTEALASVAAQTYRDYEVVIVDDGSTEERTLAALDRARGAPRTTVIRTENRGPAAARNHAIERTRGASRGWTGRGVPGVLAYYRRTPASRELNARAPGVSARLMRSLVEKHRGLYEANLEEALAGMYERMSSAGIMLERIYDHPAVRALLRLRALVRRAPAI